MLLDRLHAAGYHGGMISILQLEDVRARFRAARVLHGLSYGKLATACEWSKASQIGFEHQGESLTLAMVCAVAHALGPLTWPDGANAGDRRELAGSLEEEAAGITRPVILPRRVSVGWLLFGVDASDTTPARDTETAIRAALRAARVGGAVSVARVASWAQVHPDMIPRLETGEAVRLPVACFFRWREGFIFDNHPDPVASIWPGFTLPPL